MSYKIKDFLKRVRVPVHIEDEVDYQLVTIKVNHKGVVPRTLKKGIDIGSKTMYRVSEGQFILSGIDARHGAFGIVPKELEGAVVTNDFWYFEYDETIISKEYFLYFTSTPLFSNVCRIASEGTTNRVRLQASKFFDYEVWLPPVIEQKKLIEVVMKREVELNTLQTELKTQSNLLSKLRQAYLQEAVMGKLSEPRLAGFKDDGIISDDKILQSYNLENHGSDKLTDDKILDEKILSSFNPSGATFRNHSPDKETGKALLKAIKAQKAELIKQGKLRKEKPLPPIKPEEMPFDIPDNWVWCRLGEVCHKITDGTHHSPTNIESGDFKYITAKNIKSDGIDLSNITFISREMHKEIYSRCNPSIGDILYIKDGATTGVVTINNLEEEFSMLSSVALFKTSPLINNKYLVHLLRSPFIYKLVRNDMSGVAITRVTLQKINNFPIPLPPLSEQKAIVEKVEGLLATVSLLEEENKIQQKEVQRLMGAVLQEAFGGSI